jgi:hypothetical protein
MARSLDLFHEWFEIYPLLIFPIAVFDHGPAREGFLHNPTNKVKGKSYQMFFDLGVYGGEIYRLKRKKEIGKWKKARLDGF